VGGGIGKIFHIGVQAMNASLQAFDYPAAPSCHGDEMKMLHLQQLQFLIAHQ